MAITYTLVWMVPVSWPQSAQLAWFLAASLLFYTCFTVWSIPYQSLGYELTPNYHERTAVMGVQSFFGKLCDITADWVFPLAQLGFFVSVISGVRWVTAGIALVVFLGLGMLPGLLVRERFVSSEAPARIRKPAGFWRGAVHALRNRGMLVLMTLILLGQFSSMFTSGLDYYVLVYHVCGGDIVQGAFWKGMLSTAFSIVGVAAVWGVAWLSKRFDKRNTLTGIYALVVVGGIGKWFFFREDMPWLCLLTPLL
jgi:GPH family glycoside/pentoside/hexuronide:cation symporter